jgi:hypothetical protein
MPSTRRRPPPRQAKAAPPAVAPVASASTFSRTLMLALAVASVVALTASLTIMKLSTNDIWIHLKTGELIVSTGTMPLNDPYSFTASDREYIAHEWLSQVLFYLAYRGYGAAGLAFLKFVVMLGTAALLFLTCWTRRDRLPVVLGTFGLMSYVAGARYLERPHLFSFLFLAACLFLFFRYRDGGRNRWFLLAIVPLQVCWANLHGGFVQGLLVLAVCAAGETAAWLRARHLGSRSPQPPLAGADLLLLVSLPIVGVVASLVNPYGWRLLQLPFALTGSQAFMEEIYEWLPPLDPMYQATYSFRGYWAWFLVLFASFFFLGDASHRQRPGWQGMANGGLFLALVAFGYCFMWAPQAITTQGVWWIALAIAFVIVNVRRLDFTETGIVALMFAVSLRHNRSVADAVIGTLPILTHNLTRIVERVSRARHRVAAVLSRRWEPVLVAAAAVLLFAEAAHVQAYGYLYRPHGGTPRPPGIGFTGSLPDCAVDYIVRRGITGNAFTSYAAAALLIYRGYPTVKVGMDSRDWTVYGEDIPAEFRAARSSLPAMQAYLDKYPVDFFLVTHGDLDGSITDWLLDNGEWAQVYFDDKYVVLARRTPRLARVIDEDEYVWVHPSSSVGVQSVPAEAVEAWRQEGVRAARDCPTAWMPWWVQVRALTRQERYTEAIDATREMLARKPDNWRGWELLGGLYTQLENPSQAIAAYERALELNPQSEAATRELRRLRPH